MSDMPETMPSDPTPEPADLPRSHRWRRILLRLGIGVGVSVVAIAVVGVIWGDRIVTSLLLPRISASVDKAIKRPAKLGDVEGFTFWGVKLGKTVVPPTKTDASSITVDEIEVTVGLRSLIFQQTLKSNVVLVRPQVLLEQNADGQWTDFELPESDTAERRVKLEIQSIEIKDASISAVPFVSPEAVVTREPTFIKDTDVSIELFGEDAKEISFDVAGELEEGAFDIKGEANLNKQAVKANARLADLPTKSINLLLPDAIGIRAGELSGNLNAVAALTEEGTLDRSVTEVRGTAQFQDGELLAEALPAPLTNIRSQLLFQGQQVVIEEAGLQLNDIALTAFGDVDIEKGYDLTANIPEISVAEVQAIANFDLPVATDGIFQLDAQVIGELEQPQLQGRLASLQPLFVDRLTLDSVVADFAVTEYAEGARLPSRVDLTELRVRPQAGGVVVARGQADLRDLENPSFQLSAQTDLPADALAQIYGVDLPEGIAIGDLVADVKAAGDLNSQTAFAQWQLAGGTYPGTGEVSLFDNLVVLENTRLQSEQGAIAAEASLQLDSGNWQAVASTEQVNVRQFATQVQGLLNANIRAAGNLNALDLQQIQASGTAFITDAQVRLNETSEPLLDRGNWQTAFEWQGDRLAIDYFTAPGVQANGIVGIDFGQSTLVDRLNLNVALQSFDLQPLNSYIPASVQAYAPLSGSTRFNGQLFGTLENPQVQGQASLEQLAVNELLFETLRGPVAFSLAEGGSVDLRGQQDRLQIALNDAPGSEIPYWPSTFEVRNQDFVARGYGSGRQIRAEVAQLPLERLGIRPAPEYGFRTIGGTLQANVDVNLANFSSPRANGTLSISQPTLSPVDAQELTTRFTYADNTATVSQGELLFDNSRYLFEGSANLASNIQYEGALTIAEGRVEELVDIAEALDLSAFGFGSVQTPSGAAVDLATVPASVPDASLLRKLESFVTFIEENPAENSEQTQARMRSLPPLEELEGAFTGTIEVAGSSLALADATAAFDIEGSGWEWGEDTPPNEFALRGEVEQMGVEIETAFVNAGETQVNLSGGGDPNRLDGVLTVENLPVELAELFYPIPAAIAGDLDLETTFSGSLTNPTVRGQAIVEETQVNGYDLSKVAADFSYRNAVLNLDSEVELDATKEAIVLEGTIPYALPFMTVQPPTEQLDISAVVPNNSLEVVNALTDGQVRWQSGEGEVSVQVGGTLTNPAVVGLASFRDGTITSDQLSENITGLTGDVRFNLERIDIQQLQAKMGDGRLVVTGRLPLLPSGQPILGTVDRVQPATQAANGIVVAIENLPVDYSDLLEAKFAGQVSVTGAALSPIISGNVEINDGRVEANRLLAQAGSINLPTANEVEEISPYRVDYLNLDPLALRPREKTSGLLNRLAVQDFNVSFGDRLIVAGQPFYNISALGGLTINGSLSSLQPDGVIELKSGWINLFATQFRLDKDEPNTATFSPESGLNPFVDVVMSARVQEADISPAPTQAGGFLQAEVNESQVDTFGDVDYIRVRAVAEGPASELKDNLVLASDSSRSQGELLALLGSNVVTGITNASYLQAGEFLGAGSFNNIGDRIADVVGLQSFSVAPTTEAGDEGSTSIGIEVAATARLNDRFKLDFQQILNSSSRPLLGTQYQLTDEVTLRGASNLDDTEFELEYRIEF